MTLAEPDSDAAKPDSDAAKPDSDAAKPDSDAAKPDSDDLRALFGYQPLVCTPKAYWRRSVVWAWVVTVLVLAGVAVFFAWAGSAFGASASGGCGGG